MIAWNSLFGVDVPLTERPGGWFAQAGTENCHRVNFLNSFFFWVLFSLFAVANQLPGFSITRLASVEDFFNVNIFFDCKYNCEYKRFLI